MKEKNVAISIEEQEEVYDIIVKESFPDEYLYFSEDFIDVGKNLSFAPGRATVDGNVYSFYWSYEWGILKYSIKRIEYNIGLL